MKWNPKKYQRTAVKFMIGQGAGGLFLDPGLGKTSITLAAYLLLQKIHRGMLVICPLRPAHLVWPKEVKKWDEFKDLKMVVLHGPDKEQRLRARADVYVINPEGLPWLFKALKRAYRRKPWPFEILAVDESSKFRNTKTARFRNLKAQLHKFSRRYILTGTPAPRGLMNLFAQAYILDQGHALGRYITQYRSRYFDKTGFGGFDYVPKLGAEQQIYKRMRPLVLRMAAADYLKLPPLYPANVYIDIPDKTRKHYKEMERDLFTRFEDGKITAANAGVATGKCRQIANGGVFNNDGTTWRRMHDAKTDAVIELLDELQGQPALVAYEYHHDLQRLQQALKEAGYHGVPHIGGGVSGKVADDIETRWNAGQIPVLLGQPQSVAWGLNLQGGRAVIWHSLPWDLELYQQFNLRLHRQGQTHPVFVHHIIARGTVDEAVMGALAKKHRTQAALLAALGVYRRQVLGGTPTPGKARPVARARPPRGTSATPQPPSPGRALVAYKAPRRGAPSPRPAPRRRGL